MLTLDEARRDLPGADVLRHPDSGRITLGKPADIAIRYMRGVAAAGRWDSAALLLAGPTAGRDLIIKGRQLLRDGHLTTLDLPRVIARQNHLAARLAS